MYVGLCGWSVLYLAVRSCGWGTVGVGSALTHSLPLARSENRAVEVSVFVGFHKLLQLHRGGFFLFRTLTGCIHG